MRKMLLLIVLAIPFTRLFAQTDSYARLIKISAKDSLFTVRQPVKNKFNKPTTTSRQYLITGTNKKTTDSISRWMAAKLQQDIYRVNLAMLVSKYIGETEKNLEKVFANAENKNWILFFDEADALFGKRTDVKDAHDKYANQEVAYLLQRIEKHEGVVIIACNSNKCKETWLKKKVVEIPTE